MQRYFIILLLGMVFSAHTQEPKKSIAVLEFQSSGGLEKSELQALTNRFRGIMVQTSAFEVVEREKMGEILKEQDFAVSDQCNTSECAVQIGQLLGVRFMIAGDIGKVGQMYTIDLRMVDVSSGKIVQTKSEDYRGEVEGLLGVMRTIANSFAGRDDKAAAVTDVGDIYIISSPSKAAIYLDGKLTEWTTPKLLEGIPAGKHTIEVRSGELLAKKEIDLKKGAIENLDLKLAKLAIAVKVTSEPQEAEIYVNGELSGTTPTVINIPVGTHTVIFRKNGYQDYSESLTVKEGETAKSVKGTLKKIHKVTVTTEYPKEAKVRTVDVLVNDESAGSGTKVDLSLPEGKLIIKVRTNSADLTEFSQAVNLTGDLTVNAKLVFTDQYIAAQKDIELKKKNELDQLALQKEMERKAKEDKEKEQLALKQEMEREAKEAKEAKEKLEKEAREKKTAQASGKSNMKWYIIGGAVIAGGGAAAVLLGGKKGGGGGGPDRISDPWWP